MQSPPFPRYLVSPRSKYSYSPQHHILKHPQLSFSLNVSDQVSHPYKITGNIIVSPISLPASKQAPLFRCIYLKTFRHSAAEHGASTRILHLTLFLSSVLISVQVFLHLLASSSTFLRHVSLGLPLFRLPWGFHSTACLAMSSDSFRTVWLSYPHSHLLISRSILGYFLNSLTPNEPYMGRTAPLTSKHCILYIYSKNIGTEYFKHALYSPSFSLQSAVCFIILTCLVLVLFKFYIEDVLKLKK